MVILKRYTEAWVSVTQLLEDDILVFVVTQRTAAHRDCLHVFGGSERMQPFSTESTRTFIEPIPTSSQNQIGNQSDQPQMEHHRLSERGLEADLPCLVSKDPLGSERSRPTARKCDEEQFQLGDAAATTPGKLFVEPVGPKSPHTCADGEEQVADGY